MLPVLLSCVNRDTDGCVAKDTSIRSGSVVRHPKGRGYDSMRQGAAGPLTDRRRIHPNVGNRIPLCLGRIDQQ